LRKLFVCRLKRLLNQQNDNGQNEVILPEARILIHRVVLNLCA